DAQAAQLPADAFGLYPTVHMLGVMTAACWTHDYEWASAHLARAWPRFLRAPIHRAPFWATMNHEAHARLRINQHVLGSADARALREAERDVAVIERQSMPFAAACAERVRGRLAALNGKPAAAIERLRRSVAICEQLGAVHEAARDRYALGAALGG